MHTEFIALSEALAFTHSLRNDKEEDITHVVLSCDNVNQIGKMGVDAVVDSKLPNGDNYTWTMRRHNERPKELPSNICKCIGTCSNCQKIK